MKNFGFEFFRADVVEKEERLCSDDGDVVDAVIDEALTDGVVTASHECEFQLCADAVHAGDEHGVFHPAKVRAKKSAEAADFAEHFGAVRSFYERLNAALDAVAEVHIHASGGVGFFGFWICCHLENRWVLFEFAEHVCLRAAIGHEATLFAHDVFARAIGNGHRILTIKASEAK